MSTGIPEATIGTTGPLTRGDFLVQLYWYADTNAVPEVVGIKGLSRLARLSMMLAEDLGLNRTITPFFNFHRTPSGGIASPELWTELLALRAYQVLKPLPAGEPMPPEEMEERRFLLDHHIPPHERSHYPLPTQFERDVLTNKGTFFAAKREDQMIQRWIAVFKTVAELNRLPLPTLTARAAQFLGSPTAR